MTSDHHVYLDAFYKEEFDPTTGEPFLDRPMLPRRKIPFYLSTVEQQPQDPSSAVKLYRMVHRAYPGYVHGASPHIMDMVGGNPPRLHLHSMIGTRRHEAHRYPTAPAARRSSRKCRSRAERTGSMSRSERASHRAR